jgi:[acyl-carrier-protein] S-malonyltransferase
VSGAFHSPLMEPVVEPFRECLDAIVFHDPAVPIMSSALASPVTTAAAARAILDRQLAEPVRWVDCMRACRDHAGPSATFVELGAGRVLTGLMRRIDRSVACANFGTVSDIEALLEAAS